MTFRDVYTRYKYSDFITQSKGSKPYRGRAKDSIQYPLGYREYSKRYWMPLSVKENDPLNFDGHPIELYYSGSRLGTYHPDDTFEFNERGYIGQGEHLLLSSVIPGVVGSKVSHGGLVFEHRVSKVMHPVYYGMRINLGDGSIAPGYEYEMHVNQLDKSKTKPIREEWDGMFKTALVMLKAMGTEAIAGEALTTYQELRAKGVVLVSNNLLESFDRNDPVGAVLNLAIRYDVGGLRCLEYATPMQGSSSSPLRLVLDSWHARKVMYACRPEFLAYATKQHMYKELYKKSGDSVFKIKVVKPGDKLVTSEWGSKVYVKGVEVKRIS